MKSLMARSRDTIFFFATNGFDFETLPQIPLNGVNPGRNRGVDEGMRETSRTGRDLSIDPVQ